FGSTVSLRVNQRRKKCRPLSSNSEPRSPRGEQTQMKLLLTSIAALSVLCAAVASVANTRDDEPSPKAIDEFASNYMRQLGQQGLFDREIANQLASSIWWLRKCNCFAHLTSM